MYDFEYHKPSSVADAVKILAADPDARAISGGMTLLPALKLRLNKPTAVVDLSGIADLRGVKRDGNKIVIGALTKHYEVATSAEVKAAIPALAAMAASIGDTQVRNRGTMGGSVANNDPSADYPAALLALGATIQTDRRTISADDFFQGMFATALEAGELVTAIHIPVPEKAGYAKMRNPASRYSMAGVFVAKGPAGVRVAVNGAGNNGSYRHAGMEAALSANWSADAVAGIKVDPSDMNGDIHGSAEYRAHLVTVMAKRAVTNAG
ncbi:xanthine dehydrogenase family protein subunit M [Roseomonas stagni]|uniref:Xanthine dehydrogenase family protein subunit M n=1 Tax=Falsiroseomonas algicola TaxID=2716930 RepID=A0A6M1LJH5_9PROT|nr:xanthine dehydrogenase family protein subunit M [Falsiroseomonas algicola]NGM20496.1 xanthine dehydrogenase family protein subunit M [Falsiroseomonas algicola]